MRVEVDRVHAVGVTAEALHELARATRPADVEDVRIAVGGAAGKQHGAVDLGPAVNRRGEDENMG